MSKFQKQKFMDIELDILTGHPDHDVLFVATQVAQAAGLKAPSESVKAARRNLAIPARRLADYSTKTTEGFPVDVRGQRLRGTTVLFTEAEAYQMLLRGHAPQSEPFRQWVTSEVLPELRKNGGYALRTLEPAVGDQIVHMQEDIQAIKARLNEVLSRLGEEQLMLPLDSPEKPRGVWARLKARFSKK